MTDNQHSNPYAPPLSDDLDLQKPVPPIDKHFIELLNHLEAHPIHVAGSIPRSSIYITSTQDSSDVAPMPFALSAIAALAILIGLTVLLRVGSVMGLLLIVLCVAGSILFLIGRRKRRAKRTMLQTPSQVQIPDGTYRWFISDGGVLVTTPSGGQWCYPWSQIQNLSMHRDTWVLKPSRLMTPQWPMAADAFSEIQAELVRQLATILSELAGARRPSPAKSMLRFEWGDGLTMFHGEDWSVLREGGRVWCEVRGTTFALTASEVRIGPANLTVVDQETGWFVQLSSLKGDAG